MAEQTKAPGGMACVFPVRDAGLIDLIPQLPDQDPESIHIQGGRFRTEVLRRSG